MISRTLKTLKMKDKSQKIILAVAAVAIAGLVIWGLNQPKKAEAPVDSAEIIYYYGQDCPHCHEVSTFLEENKIAEKVNFSKKEVQYNAENAAEMGKRAGTCGLSEKDVGVPFLWARGKCLVGTPDVIDFFKKEAGL